MLFVALTEAVALTVIVVVFAGLLRSQQRAHNRREDLLVNQLLHAAGKTWQPAPADQRQPTPERDPDEPVWTARPDQQPVY